MRGVTLLVAPSQPEFIIKISLVPQKKFIHQGPESCPLFYVVNVFCWTVTDIFVIEGLTSVIIVKRSGTDCSIYNRFFPLDCWLG